MVYIQAPSSIYITLGLKSSTKFSPLPQKRVNAMETKIKTTFSGIGFVAIDPLDFIY